MEAISGAGRPTGATAPAVSKIEKAGAEFEGVLLNSVLGRLEDSFTHLPGGSESQGSEAYSGFAMQALAGAMAQGGGVGVGRMLAQALEKAEKSAGT